MSSKNSLADNSGASECPSRKKIRPSKCPSDSPRTGSSTNVYVWGDVGCLWRKDEGEERTRPFLVEQVSDDVRQIAIHDTTSAHMDRRSAFVMRSSGTVEKVLGDSDDEKITLNEHIMNKDQKFNSIVSGLGRCAGILQDGRLVTWGYNPNGILGTGSRDDGFHIPTVVSLPNHRFAQVACGFHHTVALTMTGAVFSWGKSCYAGHGTEFGDMNSPLEIKSFGDSKVSHIATFIWHSAAVTQAGKTYQWGSCYGSSRSVLSRPKKVSSLTGIRASMVSCGKNHSAILSSESKIYCWGENGHGQCGLGHNHRVDKAELVKTLKDIQVKKITCGDECTFALTMSGELYSWGSGNQEYGVELPTKVKNLDLVVVVDVVSTRNGQIAITCPRTKDFAPAPVPTWSHQFDSKESFSDVAFVVEGKELYAHRFALAQRCDFFKTMFGSGMKEGSAHVRIPIKDIQYDTFLILLKYLYTDLLNISEDNVLEVFRLADMYDLPKLSSHCCWLMRTFLTAENAVGFLKRADTFHFQAIRNICMDFVVDNFAAVSKMDGFRSMVGDELLWEIVEGRNLS